MTRYAQNGGLTRFDTGSTHELNPNGGIDIGNNNSVEENETKQDNFVYSNRIFLDSNIISQYNLPKSLVGKSVADATKMIDNKFKGRNDKISQSTKNGMLSKIAEAQEAMKPQEPEMEQGYPEQSVNPTQMALGGFADSTIGQAFGDEATADQKNAGLGAGLGAIGTVMDLGKTAFGRPSQDTSGLAASANVDAGGMITGSAMKGAQAGTMVLPGIGTAVGALVGAGAGLLGANKANKAALQNSNNYALNSNRQYSDKYAFGGSIDPNKKITVDNLINTPIVTGVKPSSQSDRFRYAVGEQGGVQHGTNGEQGHYLYYDKKPGQPGFNPAIHREFVNQGGYDTYMRSPQGQQYRRNLQLQPKQMADGGYYDKNNPYFMTNPGPTTITPTIGKTGFYGPDILPKQVFNDSSESINIPEREIIPTQTQAQFESYANQAYPNKPSFGQKVGKTINDNLSNLARYAPIAANALQLAQLKKPQGERLDRLSNRYKPEYVDEAALQNIADQTMNNTVGAIGQSGASQGQTRASILGSQLERTKAISDAYSQAAVQNRATNDRAQTFNLGVDSTNLQQSNNELDINDRNQAAYRNEKSKYISAIGNDIGDVGKEQVQKKMISTATGYTYDGKYVRSADGNVVIDPETKEPMTGEKLKAQQSSKEKKALGGYLIKNKIK